MADKIDIFYGEKEDYTFEVDNSRDVLNRAVLVKKMYALSETGNSLQQGDNIEILSIGIAFPEIYTQAQMQFLNTVPEIDYSTNPYMALSWVPNPSTAFFASELPFVNYELAMNNFVEAPSGGVPGEPLPLYLTNCRYSISMQNVPDSENGKIYYVRPFVKIRHTLDLINDAS